MDPQEYHRRAFWLVDQATTESELREAIALLKESVRLLGISISNLNNEKEDKPVEKESISEQLKFEF